MSVNERIAALNARNSPSKQSSSYPSSLTPNLGGISVKDKAARFDGIGAAPVPKGSFGLGAPPGLKEKKSHELYGNRIPSVVKPAPTGTGNASRSSSTSRGSSPSGGAGLGAGRPLTEEAVEALGTAVPDLPAAVVDSHIHASHAFHSVPPSEVDDASSSVAADMDESEDTSVRGGGGMEEESGSRSPALSTGTNTNSTISDSAMREAPPVLSPASSTTNVAGMFSSVRPSMSNVATRASSSTVPRTSSALGVAFEATPPTSLSSEHSEDVVATMDDIPMIVEEPSVAPLRLSARLLESLDVSGVGGGPASESGLATPKSVMVETGSVAGGQIVDEDMKFEGSEDNVPRNDHEEAARPMTDSMDVDVTDLASDDGTGETGETRVQPELRISGPVLPLSQSHLKSLQSSGSFSGLSASPSMRSGMETPKSTYVEDGGSVDGREREELVDRAMENDVHEEYDDAAAVEATLPVEELYTPLISNLEIEDRQQGSGSPMPQSPAVLAYAQEITGESKAAGTKDVHLVVPPPGVDGTGTSEVRTPVAGVIPLPDATIAEKVTPDPMMTPTKIEDDKQRVSSGVPIPELTLDKDDHGDSQTTPGRRIRVPSRGSNNTTPSSSRRESMISLPDTPEIIQAFPSVPTTASLETKRIGTIPEIVSTSYEDRRSTVGGPLSSAQQRVLKTHGKSASGSFLEPTTGGASGVLRRSASSSNVGVQQVKKKKSQKLVPGVWIDDDTPFDEEDEPGWARIVVSRQSYQA